MESHTGDVQEQSGPASEPSGTNRTHEPFEPLVTSHGKVCFWCAKENATDCAFVIPDPSSDEDGQATPITQTGVGFELQNDQETQITPATPCQAFEQTENCPDDIPHIMEIPGIPGLCGLGDTPKPPELLYRWSNNDSQGINTGNLLVAGLFVKNYPQIPSPYQCSIDEFLRLFKVHVTRKKVPTPFISAFARPIAPLHRALRNGHQAKITLIDTCIMPSLQGYVLSAQPLAQITDTIVDRWKGYGEYAIWGSIPREAIVTTFSLADIEKIARDDPEVRQFLQLDLIRGEATCHRGLRRKLRENLRSLRIEDNRPALRRLAWHLDVPEEWHEVFTQDMHDAWTMDLGGNNQVLEGEGDLPMVQDEAWPGPLGQAFMNAVRGFRESSETTISYVPPLSDGGSPSEPTSEEHESPSQSPIGANRRRDTPSSTYSMNSDSDDSFTLLAAQNALRTTDADIAELSAPRSPDQTSRYFDQPDRFASITHSPGSDMLGLPTQVPLDHDPTEASDWPSDGEIHFGNDTPSKCHYLSRPLSQITRDRDGDIARLPDLGAPGRTASIFYFGDHEQSRL
ncbi:Uncharacterized protein PECH_003535 [Penicillium ucsense]|uniref:DUF7587 domain-containing protein n=1 Tax=Penicillium ucsense TaxID=2839758 RepID=A0A8J8WID7_9EURO|nr:Uncharacterized protein PECM_007424 [Penicillium ucsense]KAF7737615.1 Uncharacterized protein PECH_003535 [Penicillium ucsense]